MVDQVSEKLKDLPIASPIKDGAYVYLSSPPESGDIYDDLKTTIMDLKSAFSSSSSDIIITTPTTVAVDTLVTYDTTTGKSLGDSKVLVSDLVKKSDLPKWGIITTPTTVTVDTLVTYDTTTGKSLGDSKVLVSDLVKKADLPKWDIITTPTTVAVDTLVTYDATTGRSLGDSKVLVSDLVKKSDLSKRDIITTPTTVAVDTLVTYDATTGRSLGDSKVLVSDLVKKSDLSKRDIITPTTTVANSLASYKDTTGKIFSDSGLLVTDLVKKSDLPKWDIVTPVTTVTNSLASYKDTTGKVFSDSGLLVTDVVKKADLAEAIQNIAIDWSELVSHVATYPIGSGTTFAKDDPVGVAAGKVVVRWSKDNVTKSAYVGLFQSLIKGEAVVLQQGFTVITLASGEGGVLGSTIYCEGDGSKEAVLTTKPKYYANGKTVAIGILMGALSATSYNALLRLPSAQTKISDSLTDTSVSRALSANAGKTLKDLIDEKAEKIDLNAVIKNITSNKAKVDKAVQDLSTTTVGLANSSTRVKDSFVYWNASSKAYMSAQVADNLKSLNRALPLSAKQGYMLNLLKLDVLELPKILIDGRSVKKIILANAPTGQLDATNKTYVDTQIAAHHSSAGSGGLWKGRSVRYFTSNRPYHGFQKIDEGLTFLIDAGPIFSSPKSTFPEAILDKPSDVLVNGLTLAPGTYHFRVSVRFVMGPFVEHAHRDTVGDALILKLHLRETGKSDLGYTVGHQAVPIAIFKTFQEWDALFEFEMRDIPANKLLLFTIQSNITSNVLGTESYGFRPSTIPASTDKPPHLSATQIVILKG